MSNAFELNDCRCCAQETSQTAPTSRPGLNAIDYRIAVYGSFFKRMIARMGREAIPDGDHQGQRPLRDLSARTPDDFSIGLLDAWAVIGDVLTFYQERIANEGFLRTATERRSILELARAIGYELNPGVAADTYLAFTVDESDTTPDSIEIPAGTQVQSLPQAQDELPQTFETDKAFTARPEWNRFVPCQTIPQTLSPKTTEIVFQGIQTNLRTGDRLLIIEADKEDEHNSSLWDVRRVLSVNPNPATDQTTVTVADSSKTSYPSAPLVYVFREKANIFGHNAADWPALSNQIKSDYLGHGNPALLSDEDKVEWPRFTIFAPGSVVSGEVVLKETVFPTARMVVDAAVGAAEKQAKFLTRSAVASVPTAAFSVVSVLETLTKELLGLVPAPADSGSDGIADDDSPLTTIVASIQTIIKNITFSPPDTDSVAIYKQDVYKDRDPNILENLFFGNIDNLKPNILIEKINTALGDLLQLPFTLGLADSSDVNEAINDINEALNDLWELNPTLKIINAFKQVLTAVGEDVEKAANQAKQSFDDAAGAGAASAISSILEMVLENAMAFDPQPNDIVRLARFTTKVARYASALPAATMPEADAWRGLYYQIENLVAGESITDPFVNIISHLSGLDDLPEEMKNLSDNENRMAFYTALGAMGAGAAGAGLAFGAGAVGAGSLTIASPVLGAALAPSLIPLMGLGIVPLLAAAPGFASGVDEIYNVANRAAEKAATPVTKPLGVKRGFPISLLDSVDLDKRYSKIVPNSWVYFSTASNDERYFVQAVTETSRAEYMISASISRLQLDGPKLSDFEDTVRELTVFAAPEELTLAEIPKSEPVAGTSIAVDTVLPALSTGQTLIVSGVPTGEAETAAETVVVQDFRQIDGNIEITLQNGLTRSYTRSTVDIFGNVVAASHGETVADEVLGHGAGSVAHQSLILKKAPLTYTSANTASGSQSSLTVRVDNVAWTRVDSLYQQAAAAKVYATRIDDDAKATVHFGDGRMGSRLPTGLENVQATYRSGIGLEGEVDAGTLTLLKTKPYGVKSVTNPVAADGADDPEKLDNARQNAPMTVRTLDRIVSRWDYEDFAATFAGIGKAQAVPIWDGTRELIHITVADPAGNSVGADKIALLLAAMEAVRDRLREVIVENFIAKTFSLSARVKIDAAYEWNALQAALEEELKETFSFAQRQFGQAVSAAEILALMHAVDGVIAIDLDELYIDGIGQDHTLSGVLGAGIATYDNDSTAAALADRITPAGLLTINPDGIVLKEKTR